jgi:hypothetical protein
MASQVPYDVVCGVSGETLTEWREMSPIYYYSKSSNASKTSFLHLDNSLPQVRELLDTIKNAQAELWELHNQSPTSLRGKERAESTEVVEQDEVLAEVAPY